MKKFSDILATLDNADHVRRVVLFDRAGNVAGAIENQPGSQGSIRVYHHLYQKWGSIGADAAQEGLVIYAEHTQDARDHPGKHPNIDRLFGIVARNDELTVEVDS